MSRRNRWKGGWFVSTAIPLSRPLISAALKFETPTWRILPSSTSSDRAPAVSSNGVS